MTQRRADRMRRITGVQRQMQRAAEWDLHDLRRQEYALRAAQHETLTALTRDDTLLLALAPTLSRRLCSLGSQADALTAAGDRQAEFVREQTGRLKHAERLERAIGGEVAREGKRKALENLVDRIAGNARATIP